MRSKFRTLEHLCAVFLLMLAVGCVQAWAQLDTGGIAGTVQDKSGAVISGATVKVTNTKTGRVWEAKTGSIGEYSVTGLPVGPYKVEVSQQGFKNAAMSDIILHPAETPRADLTLEVGSSGETVTVNAEAAAVNTTTSESGATIDSRSVSNLPLNGRDFTSLIALVPGSVTTGNFGQNSLGGFETSLAGVNVLLDGTDATRIDVNATSTQLGRQESRISRASVDSIQEFKVLSGVYSAEYGRSSGDIVNVITKSGGNDVHGTIFEFFRNNALDANNYFAKDGQDTPLHMNQFGGNLSGPIKRDKVFFFVNYEGVRQIVNNPTTVTVLSQSGRAGFDPSMFPVRDAIPLPNLPDPVTYVDNNGITQTRTDLGWYFTRLRNELREDTGSVKIDYNASQKDSFAFRYNIADSFTSTQYGVALGQVSPSYSRNHLFKGTWNHTFSTNLLNEFGVAFNRPQTDSLGGGDGFPIFQCSAFWGCNSSNNLGATPGPALFSNRRPQYSIQFLDTVSWVKGRHTIRTGVDIRKNNTDDALDPQEFLTYDGLANFKANVAIQLDTLGHTMVNVHNTNYGVFIQDDIRLATRFTLNLGLRYEFNSVLQGDKIGNFDIATLTLLPEGKPLYKPDRNDFAPRIGFSWDPLGRGKTVIRGGAGMFYNPLLTGAALSLASNYQQNFSVNFIDLAFGLRTCTPSFPLGFLIQYPVPNPLPVCDPALPTSVNGLDQNMRDTYAMHWSFGIQQELAKSTVMEVSYVGNRGVKLPAGAAYAGLEYNYDSWGVKQYSQYGNIRRLGNFLDSNYNAMQVSLRRRVGQGLTVDANYTWSHELDDAVNILLSAFQNSMNPGMDYADGDIDVRHNFTLGMVYDVPKPSFMSKGFGGGWQISTLLQTRSGLPVNVANSAPFLGLDQVRPDLTGQPIQGSGAPNNVLNPGAFVTPPANTYGDARRNAGRGPGFAQWDMGLGKTAQLTERYGLQFRVEMFNLLNHPNFANPVGYRDDPNFGKSTSTIGTRVGTGTSRQTQLSLKLLF